MKLHRTILPKPIARHIDRWRLERIRRANAHSYETRNWLERHNAQMRAMGRPEKGRG